MRYPTGQTPRGLRLGRYPQTQTMATTGAAACSPVHQEKTGHSERTLGHWPVRYILATRCRNPCCRQRNVQPQRYQKVNKAMAHASVHCPLTERPHFGCTERSYAK